MFDVDSRFDEFGWFVILYAGYLLLCLRFISWMGWFTCGLVVCTVGFVGLLHRFFDLFDVHLLGG